MDLPAMQTLLLETRDLFFQQNILLLFKLTWLRDVWKFLLERNLLADFKDIPLMPVVTQGQWPTPLDIQLAKLSDLLIVKEVGDSCLPEDVCVVLKYLNVKVIPALPTWIPSGTVDKYIFMPHHDSFLKMLGAVASQKDVKKLITSFNDCVSNKEAFVRYISEYQHIDAKTQKMLKLLKIFHVINSRNDSGRDTSMSDMRPYVSLAQLDYFPENVDFPWPIFIAKHGEERLILALGAKKTLSEDLVLECISRSFHHHKLSAHFMQQFFPKFHYFEKNNKIVKAASNLHFLKVDNDTFYKASDLFDPSDPLLQDLLSNEGLLPVTTNILSGDVIRVLKCLGMKDSNNLTAMHLLQVATTLHLWSGTGDVGGIADTMVKKANALIKFLNMKPYVVNELCHGRKTLKECMACLSCVPFKTSNLGTSYPDCLPWYTHSKTLCTPKEAKSEMFCKLVGGTVPIAENASMQLSDALGWNTQPVLQKIILQLTILCKHFSTSIMPDIMPLLKAIYSSLAKRIPDVQIWLKEAKDASSLEIIWNGSSFVKADQIILHSAYDIKLEPYYFWLPETFANMSPLFTLLGCHQTLDQNLLINTVKTIKLHYDQSTSTDTEIVKRDRFIVLSVLERLAKMKKDNDNACIENMLMLVRTVGQNSLTLLPVSACAICDDSDNYFDDSSDAVVNFVDSRVSLDTAKILGVQTVARKSLAYAEYIEYEKCQKEQLTETIHALLRDRYTDELSLPKELIRNADDAEATCVKFIYDERQNNDFQKKLLTKEMKEYQGPALWVYNDRTFSIRDFENIVKLNGPTKERDVANLGKSGLGFCSVYNLTDVPSLISGSHIVIFDPLAQYLNEIDPSKIYRGIKISRKLKNLINGHSDQFKPYEGIFGCSILGPNSVEYNGTLIRLPLRTETQSKTSKISQKIYSKSEMTKLLRMLIETAGNMLLFTNYVKKIEIYHIEDQKGPINPKLCFCIDKETLVYQKGEFSPMMTSSILARSVMPTLLKDPQSLLEIHKVIFVQTLKEKARNVIGLLESHPEKANFVWLLSWATGINRSLQLSTKMKYATPLAAVAIPCTNTLIPVSLDSFPGFYKEGRVFNVLPLSINSQLNFHVNGCFAVAVDTKHILPITKDDKHSPICSWNEALQQDALLRSYLQLLEVLTQQIDIPETQYSYYSLWPTSCSEVLAPFRNSFFKTVLEQKQQLFKGEGAWVSFDKVIFLDPLVRNDPVNGSIAFEMLCKYPITLGKCVIEMPDQVLRSILDFNSAPRIKQAQISEEQIILHFLNMVGNEYWKDKEIQRNTMILRALSLDNTKINSVLSSVPCIPTKPNGKLRTPGELIDTDSNLSDLFSVDDERFPLSLECFREKAVIIQLLKLGMKSNNTILSKPLLIDRCHSVEAVAQVCVKCAKMRIVSVLKYISKEPVLKIILTDTSLISELQQIFMIPVLNSPHWCSDEWNAYKNDTLKRYDPKMCKLHDTAEECELILGKSRQLFRQRLANIIGSLQNIMNEKVIKDEMHAIKPEIFEFLGIKDNKNVQLKDVACQIRTLSYAYVKYPMWRESITRSFLDIYDFIHMTLTENTEMQKDALDVFQTLVCEPVVLIGDELVKASNVAFNVRHACPPSLYKVPESEALPKEVLKVLGVKENFSIDDVIFALDLEKRKWDGKKCEELEHVCNILRNLQDVMTRENTSYKDLYTYKDRIIAPDKDCYLLPTCELVMDDAMYKSNCKMKFVHGSISPDLAMTLGIKSKKARTFEGFSKARSFGQREELVKTLPMLHHNVSFDSSIPKQFVHNADNANASEIHFIKDFSMHKRSNTFGSGQIGGPFLYVFNDSCFTRQDFEDIHNFGKGNQDYFLSKTGQCDVGFNVVYRLTDVPSIFTMGPNLGKNGSLCILDPLRMFMHEYLSEKECGIIFDVEEINENFSDVMDEYNQCKSLFSLGVGTLYRLPLRNVESDFGNIVSMETMNDIMNSLKADLSETLLLVKNIKCIRVSNIVDGDLHEEYSIQTEMSPTDESKRKDFFQKVKSSAVSKTSETPFEVNYTMTVKDTHSKSSLWHVVQRFGCKASYEAGNAEMNQLPIGGVAIPLIGDNLTENQSECASTSCLVNAFCSLSAPESSVLPFHFTGHFILDRLKGSFANYGQDDEWNNFVLREIVSVAWVSAITFLKNRIVVGALLNTASQCISMHTLVGNYYRCFPVCDDKISESDKVLANAFYTYVVENAHPIFPVLTKITDKAIKGSDVRQHCKACFHKLSITWVPFSKSEESFAGIFNDIQSHLNKDEMYEQKVIETTLKRLGLKIINANYSVQNTMEKVGVKLYTTTPHLVAIFLKSFQSMHESKRNLGNINVPVDQTMMRSSANVCSLIKYIKLDEHFVDNLEGLPLLLTNDNILRVFDNEHPVFCSKFATLLPKSSDRFIHIDLVAELSDVKCGALTRFEINDLLNFMPDSFDTRFAQSAKIKWDKESGDPINSSLLKQFYQFIYSESLNTAPNGKTLFNAKLFAENVTKFHNWSLMPSMESNSDTIDYVLVPVRNASHLISKAMMNNDDKLKPVLEKINLPTFDDSVFDNEEDMKQAMTRLLSCSSTPSTFVECLLINKQRILSSNLTLTEAQTLLAHINRNITKFSKTYGGDSKTNLRSLPLFLTQPGFLSSLEEASEVCVLPQGMPQDGIEEWSSATKVILLISAPGLAKLYKYLNLQEIDIMRAYVEKLLPTMDFLPKYAWSRHIEYIRDQLFNSHLFKMDDSNQQKLVKAMRDLQFVQVKEIYQKVHCFYCYNQELFRLMVDQDKFLPEEYRTDLWRPFLKALGLNVSVSDKMILNFARQIEEEGRCLSEHTKMKSDSLVSYFLSHKWKLGTIQQIKHIKFVVPYLVSDEKRAICNQPNSGLICFSDALPYTFKDICWTSVNLLEKLPEDQELSKLLGILETPNLEDVIRHCQNVCERFESMLEVNSSCTLVGDTMEKLYDFLSSNFLCDNKLLLQSLQHIPFLYLPDDNMIVKARTVVINLTPDEEIKPYLFSAPKCYVSYFDLFEVVGCSRTATCANYAAVLEQLKIKYDDDPLPNTALDLVRKALGNMERILITRKDMSLHSAEPLLYLPNKDKVLRHSNSLVFSNRRDFEKRLKNNCVIDYFMGFKELNLNDITDPVALIKTLPINIRLNILTEIVEEIICTDNVIEKESMLASNIEHFVHSPDFHEGVLRLVKHELTKVNRKLTPEQVHSIIMKLSHVKVKHVLGLKTLLSYQSQIVNGTERSKTCCIKKSNGVNDTTDSEATVFTLFFQSEGNKEVLFSSILAEDDGLIQLIDKCTESSLGSNMFKLYNLFNCIGNPESIQEELDRMKIDSYDIPHKIHNPVFRGLGKYVEQKFHPFLEQGITPFFSDEFQLVALELEDAIDNYNGNDATAYEPVYIYAQIISKVKQENGDSSLQYRYAINIGDRGCDEPIHVPIYRLYKFVQRTPDTDDTLVPYNEDSSFEEISIQIQKLLTEAWSLELSERKRIIRRMCIKWHPDRHVINKKYFSRIFNFVKVSIKRLEAAELGNITSEETGDCAPDLSQSSYMSMLTALDDRAKRLAREFYNNWEDYTNSDRTGTYSHFNTGRISKMDVPEAKRWLDQARMDYKTATRMLPYAGNTPSYNWLCYLCHQSCEKALKAARFLKEADNISFTDIKNHSLSSLAEGIDASDVSIEVRRLEAILGGNNHYTNMRYPDTLSRPLKPSDMYTEKQAIEALQIAGNILGIVTDFIKPHLNEPTESTTMLFFRRFVYNIFSRDLIF